MGIIFVQATMRRCHPLQDGGFRLARKTLRRNARVRPSPLQGRGDCAGPCDAL
jgi:hypothetical protein